MGRPLPDAAQSTYNEAGLPVQHLLTQQREHMLRPALV